MKDHFCPHMEVRDINNISMLGLAHIGDAVYELLTRTMLCAERLLPLLTEEEMCVFRRGRNAKVNSVPQKADIYQYHAATGLEALFGWLYLQGKTERINQLFAECVEEHDGA